MMPAIPAVQSTIQYPKSHQSQIHLPQQIKNALNDYRTNLQLNLDFDKPLLLLLIYSSIALVSYITAKLGINPLIDS
ncbi:MAG: hypothetical protein V5A68_06155 [Candidatus Thermoplasmatota archaeon]